MTTDISREALSRLALLLRASRYVCRPEAPGIIIGYTAVNPDGDKALDALIALRDALDAAERNLADEKVKVETLHWNIRQEREAKETAEKQNECWAEAATKYTMRCERADDRIEALEAERDVACEENARIRKALEKAKLRMFGWHGSADIIELIDAALTPTEPSNGQS